MRISRLELYELVSKSPLSKVAPGLGVSATALAEIAERTTCRIRDQDTGRASLWGKRSLLIRFRQNLGSKQ